MQERIATVGGQLTITSEPDAGCKIIAVFPAF
jgi:signal transduction histidine kinase